MTLPTSRLRARILSILTVIGLASVASVVPASVATAADPTLSFTVMDGEADLAISGADVSIYSYSNPEVQFFGTSNESGQFEIVLPPDVYTLYVGSFGYGSFVLQFTAFADATITPTVVLDPARSSIAGTVVDDGGLPIDCTIDPESGFSNCPQIYATRTDASGNGFARAEVGTGDYSLLDLTAGTWEIRAAADGYFDSAVQTIELLVDQNLVDLDFVLERIVYGSVSGRVTDINGNGIEGIRVDTIEVTDLRGLAASTTDANGDYLIENVAVGGPYTARFLDDFVAEGVVRNPGYATTFLGGGYSIVGATEFTVADGVTTTDIDQVLVLGGSVQGQVSIMTPDGAVDSAPPWWPGPVFFTEVEGDWVEYDFVSPFAGSGPVGSYEINGMPPGDYRVGFIDSFGGPRAFSTVFWPNASTVDEATSITVSAGVISAGIDVTVQFPYPLFSPTPVGEAALVGEYEGIIAAPASANQGETVTIDVGVEYAGEWVSPWAYSEPTTLGADWAQVDSLGRIAVEIPADLPVGPHRVAVQLVDASLVGWQPIEVGEGVVESTHPAATKLEAVVTRLEGFDRVETSVAAARVGALLRR